MWLLLLLLCYLHLSGINMVHCTLKSIYHILFFKALSIYSHYCGSCFKVVAVVVDFFFKRKIDLLLLHINMRTFELLYYIFFLSLSLLGANNFSYEYIFRLFYYTLYKCPNGTRKQKKLFFVSIECTWDSEIHTCFIASKIAFVSNKCMHNVHEFNFMHFQISLDRTLHCRHIA